MIAGFLSFATTKTGRWIVGGAIVVVIVWAWLMNHNRTLINMERLRQERKSRITQDKIRKSNNEKSTQVERARDAAPRNVPHSDGVPGELTGILFGDN